MRIHRGPTSRIYAGRKTMKYTSRDQRPPSITSRILKAVQSGSADFIFAYRHPLDSLLTNRVWWRTYIREKRMSGSFRNCIKNTDDLCAVLEQNFPECGALRKVTLGFGSTHVGRYRIDRLRIPPPRTQPFHYWAVQQKVGPFKAFVDGLSPKTKKLIARIDFDPGNNITLQSPLNRHLPTAHTRLGTRFLS